MFLFPVDLAPLLSISILVVYHQLECALHIARLHASVNPAGFGFAIWTLQIHDDDTGRVTDVYVARLVVVEVVDDPERAIAIDHGLEAVSIARHVSCCAARSSHTKHSMSLGFLH